MTPFERYSLDTGSPFGFPRRECRPYVVSDFVQYPYRKVDTQIQIRAFIHI